MSAAVGQSVMHLVGNAPACIKESQNTKPTEEAPEPAFGELLSQEDEPSAPKTAQPSPQPEKPAPKESREEAPTQVDRTQEEPEDATQEPSFDNVIFPKEWARQETVTRDAARGAQIDPEAVLADHIGTDRLIEEPLDTQTKDGTHPNATGIVTHRTALTAPQEAAAGTQSDFLHKSALNEKSARANSDPQNAAHPLTEAPEQTPIAPMPVVEEQEQRTDSHAEKAQDETHSAHDQSALATKDGVKLVSTPSQIPPLKNAPQKEVSVAQSTPETASKKAPAHKANTHTLDKSAPKEAAPISFDPETSLFQSDTPAPQDARDPFGFAAHMQQRGDTGHIAHSSARLDDVSQIILQKSATQESSQATFIRTPAYTLVHVDMKMPSLTEAGTLKMRLDPAHLGKVEVEVTLTHDGRIDAVVNLSKSETFEMMRHNGDEMARVIADAFGHDLGTLEFSLSAEGQDNTPFFEDGPQGRHGTQEPSSSHIALAFQTQQIDPARMLDALA